MHIQTDKHAYLFGACMHTARTRHVGNIVFGFVQIWKCVRRCCEVSPNGRYIAAGCDDSRTAECNGRRKPPRNAATLDQPARMYIYDLLSCQCIQECDGHSGRVHESFEVLHIANGRWAVAGSLEPRPEADHQCREGGASCDSDSHHLHPFAAAPLGFQDKIITGFAKLVRIAIQMSKPLPTRVLRGQKVHGVDDRSTVPTLPYRLDTCTTRGSLNA